MKIITPTIRPTHKQYLAWQALQDEISKYVCLGGGAGGGKSWLICEWLLTNAYFYPGIKSFIGRNELKRLMGSTFLTFIKVCVHHKIPKEDWKLNGQYNYIEFKNGSRIDLLDVAYQPSDPEYQRFGSLEYTNGALEEIGEINFGAFDILKSRVNRHKNNEFKLKSKILMTCNPTKGWPYTVLYLPWKEKRLPSEYVFIPALYIDNQYAMKDYGENLAQISDQVTKQRLMYGNWEYDDDPASLIKYEAILDLFTNTVDGGERFIVVDVARFGDDKTIITLWDGFKLTKVTTLTKAAIDTTANKIRELAEEERVPYSHIIIDEDGVGGGCVDILRGVKGFVANSKPFDNPITHQPDNFQNLKAQCAYLLADYVNNHKISVEINDTVIKSAILAELEQIKSKDSDKEGKRKLISKDEVKEILGRSPDIGDCFIMRMFFQFNPSSFVHRQAPLPQSRTYSTRIPMRAI